VSLFSCRAFQNRTKTSTAIRSPELLCTSVFLYINWSQIFVTGLRIFFYTHYISFNQTSDKQAYLWVPSQQGLSTNLRRRVLGTLSSLTFPRYKTDYSSHSYIQIQKHNQTKNSITIFLGSVSTRASSNLRGRVLGALSSLTFPATKLVHSFILALRSKNTIKQRTTFQYFWVRPRRNSLSIAPGKSLGYLNHQSNPLWRVTETSSSLTFLVREHSHLPFRRHIKFKITVEQKVILKLVQDVHFSLHVLSLSNGSFIFLCLL
jgi:hypothetical protein